MRVGVFVSEVPALIREAVDAACLDLVQLHRRLTPEDPGAYGVPVVAVAHWGSRPPRPPPPELLSSARRSSSTRAFPAAPEEPASASTGASSRGGSSARRFFSPAASTPATSAEAIRRVRPWGVDVASGVETSPGVKDAQKMRRFFEAVRSADGAAA